MNKRDEKYCYNILFLIINFCLAVIIWVALSSDTQGSSLTKLNLLKGLVFKLYLFDLLLKKKTNKKLHWLIWELHF